MGDVQVNNNDYGYRPLKTHAGPYTLSGITLNTQGIFGSKGTVGNVEIGGKGSLLLWGFSRSGQWLRGHIEFHKRKPHATELGNWVLDIKLFEVNTTTLDELLPTWNLTPYFELGRAIRAWHDAAHDRYFEIKRLLKVVDLEDTIVDFCVK